MCPGWNRSCANNNDRRYELRRWTGPYSLRNRCCCQCCFLWLVFLRSDFLLTSRYSHSGTFSLPTQPRLASTHTRPLHQMPCGLLSPPTSQARPDDPSPLGCPRVMENCRATRHVHDTVLQMAACSPASGGDLLPWNKTSQAKVVATFFTCI